MSSIIKIQQLNIIYDDNHIIKNLNLNIPQNKFNILIGPTSSGKTTIIKSINHLIPYNGEIYYKDKQITDENINVIRPQIATIYQDPNMNCLCNTVLDTLVFPLENQNMSRDQIQTNLNTLLTYYDYSPIKNKEVIHLTYDTIQIVNLLSNLIYNPSLLIIDNAFSTLSPVTKATLLDIIAKYRATHDLTILMITTYMEDTPLADNLIVLNKGEIYLQGKPQEVLKDNAKLQKIGLDVPFINDLSQGLICYNLIDKPYTDIRKLVNTLWK